MITNLAESYNMIMRRIRIIPLVGIVEFLLYECTDYFMKHHDAFSLTLMNQALVSGDKIT
jgi:hypothetical protein